MKIYLSADKKERIRERIMARINASDPIIGFIRQAVAKLSLNLVAKARMREHVFARAEMIIQKSFFWQNFFTFQKKLVSAALVLVLAMSFFSFWNVDTMVVRAESFTVIDDVNGEVFVERNGQTIDATVGMKMYEDDRLLTKNGTAVVHYFDDSVSRLAVNTGLQINKLVHTDNQNLRSYVEVFLINGSLWSRVVSLVDEESSFVVKAKDVATNAKQAAFNVQVVNDGVEVEVFNRSVNVQHGEVVKSDKLLSGQRAVVKNGIKVEYIADAEKNSEWVQNNLREDERYIADVEGRLIAAKMKVMGIDPMKRAEFEATLSDKAFVYLTFDDVKKQKKGFEIAERAFVAAQLTLNDENASEEEKNDAIRAMDNFAASIDQFNTVVKEVAYTDKKYARELNDYLGDRLLSHKKDLSVVLPDKLLYKAKEVVDAGLVSAVSDDKSQLLNIKLDLLADKLGELEEMQKNPASSEQLKKLIATYKSDLDDVKQMLVTLDDVEDEYKAELNEKLANVERYIIALGNEKNGAPVIVATPKPKPVADKPVVVAMPAVDGDSGLTEQTAATATATAPSADTTTVTAPVDGKFGVTIQGGKPLSPIFDDEN